MNYALIEIPAGELDGRPVAAFWCGEYPVTRAQYREFCAVTKREIPAECGADGDDLPATYVSAPDADAFCGWSGLQLLTRDEWQYACRAGGPDRPEDVLDVAWCWENSKGRVHPVGQKKPNAFGLYDMLGNVWEWTSEAVGSSRVLRGGGWASNANDLRGSFRLGSAPSFRNGDLGFRCGVSHQTSAQPKPDAVVTLGDLDHAARARGITAIHAVALEGRWYVTLGYPDDRKPIERDGVTLSAAVAHALETC